MKILAIGDPHGDLETIKQIPINNIDLILLTGDLGSATLMREMAFDNRERKKQGLPERKYSPKQEKRAFMEAYITTLQIIRYLSKFAPVYTIFGNVESSNYETRRKSKKIGLPLPLLTDELNNLENVYVINNKILSVNGRRIGGLEYFLDKSWVKSFVPGDKKKSKVAIKQTDKARMVLQKFRSLYILVCHQPPFGILDKVTAKFAPKHTQGKNAGSKLTLNYIKKHKPRYVFCGHIHEGKGEYKIGKTEVYNLGVCGYKIINIAESQQLTKHKIFKIFKTTIETFTHLSKIELIATFGSILDTENPDFGDLDVITLSDKQTHDEFISHLKSQLYKRRLAPVVFETIIKKPKKKQKNQVFIHDLNYRSISDLLSKEWKSVINTMNFEMVVIYGDKTFPNKLPLFKLSKDELLNKLHKWSKQIKTRENFKSFQEYLIKIIPKLLQDYSYIDLENLKEAQNLLLSNTTWNKKLKEVRKFLA